MTVHVGPALSILFGILILLFPQILELPGSPLSHPEQSHRQALSQFGERTYGEMKFASQQERNGVDQIAVERLLQISVETDAIVFPRRCDEAGHAIVISRDISGCIS
jgi:hypothetical protein